MGFDEMVVVQDRNHSREPWEYRILSFDPGHTTGYAVFTGIELTQAGQLDTTDMENGPRTIRDLIQSVKPAFIICEDYRVYKWRKDHHVGSEMLTTRVIGAIETVAAFDFIPVVKNMAVVAKRFVTDARLKDWGMWRDGERHARDAIRHGCYFILFHHQMLKDGKLSKSHTVG